MTSKEGLVHSACGGEGGGAREDRVKGPVEILCREIEFEWDRRLEREDVFIAFVRELVEEVAQRREIAGQISRLTGVELSDHGGHLVCVARSMTALDLGLSREARCGLAETIHDRSHEINPEDGRNCDHEVDMLASCASAIRFGLESPCRSRHAADAADHVWRHLYGVSRFDGHTPAWRKSWARSKLTSAILSLLPSIPASRIPPLGTEQAQRREVSPNNPEASQ